MIIDWSWLVGILLAVELIITLGLMERQRRVLSLHRNTVPPAFVTHLSLAEHQKAADYGRDRLRLGQYRKLFSTLLIATLLWSGMVGTWDAALFDYIPHRIGQPLAFLGLMGLGSALLALPWKWYSQFVIEERYGFNRMTPQVFCADLAKGAILATILGLLLLVPILWMMAKFPVVWVVVAFSLWTIFQLVLGWLWPRFIAPLFNRFTSLQDAHLNEGIQRLVEKAGFRSQGVYVMDASKRSGHGNAYFTGLGKNKRIVFFDTLMAQITPTQILAVLAHEVGHLKFGHVRKGLLLGIVFSAIGFALVGWLQMRIDLFLNFGMIPTPGSLILMASWLIPLAAFPLTPLLSWLSRRHEFEADQYAVKETSSQDLGEALLALHRNNAASVVYDSWYANFNFSHPPLSIRLKRMGYQA